MLIMCNENEHEILVKHGVKWCLTADQLEEGAIILSEDELKRMGPDTFGVFEIRHEKHESVHCVGLAPCVSLARVYATGYILQREGNR